MSSSSSMDRERDRYPTPAQVHAFMAEDLLQARNIFSKQIHPMLTDLANYSIDAHGRLFIAFRIPMTFTDDFLQKLQTIVTQEFIATTPGWRITHFKPPVTPKNVKFYDYTQIIIREDIVQQ